MNPELFSQAIGFKVADPEVIFDDDPLLPTSSRRFVAAAVDFNFSSQRPGFVIGTAAELPENGWTTHRIEIADLPLPSQFPPEVYWHIDGVNLAADSDLVYVNAIARNGVLNAGNKYEYRNLTVVLSKASLLAGTVVVVAKVYEPELFNASRERTSFSRGAEDSLADRHTYDDTPQYLASMRVAETAQTVVDLGYVDLAAGTIVRLPLTLPVSYLEPAPADQPDLFDPPSRIDCFDAKVWANAVYRNGSMWFCHHLTKPEAPDRVVTRWYEVAMNDWGLVGGGTPALVQWGEIDPQTMSPPPSPGERRHAIYPSIAVAEDGRMAMTYQRTSNGIEKISIRAAARDPSDPAGQLTTHALIKDSVSIWGATAGPHPRCDYSGIVPDVGAEADACLFWLHHEFVGGPPPPPPASQLWKTWVAPWSPCQP